MMIHRRSVSSSLRFLWTTFLLLSDPSWSAEEESSNENDNDDDKPKGTIIGIDLGTTYSCVGAFTHSGRVEILPNDQGNRITPSYVAFVASSGGNGGGVERLVGDAAKNQATLNPSNTIFDVKRLIGRQYDDESVQSDKKLMPYDIIDVDGQPYVQIDRGNSGELSRYAPEEVSAMVLSKMRSTAESYLGKRITRAVITVPAYFNDAQRHATKDAGSIAGLTVERILNEPTAAAIAYGMDDSESEEEKNVVVFDLGGGTFDVTVLSIDGGVFQVLSTNGDTHLGGSDFDQRVVAHYVDFVRNRTGKDVSNDKRALQKLRREVERVKRSLSYQFQARLDVEGLVDGYDLSDTLTRAKFEELNADLFKKTLKPVERAMEDATMDVNEIDEIVLVGGSTRIPKIREMVSEYFGGKEPAAGVNPDEAVAYGAAVQGGILSGEGGDAAKSILLLDATPLSLGTETVGGVMTVLIKRGTTIPTERSKEFHTIEDNQSHMTIDVYEGERSMVADNHLLGLFEMTDIPPAPRGAAKVLVTFAIDANGMLEVTAEDRANSKNVKKITIEPESGRLSQDDVDRMVKDAERHAEEDRRAADRIQARNDLESFVYELSGSMREHEDQIKAKGASAEDVKALIDEVDEVMDWIESNQEGGTEEEFRERHDRLRSLSGPLMSRLYSDGGGDDGEEGGGGGFGRGVEDDDEL